MRHAFMNYQRKLCKVTSFKKKAAMIRVKVRGLGRGQGVVTFKNGLCVVGWVG